MFLAIVGGLAVVAYTSRLSSLYLQARKMKNFAPFKKEIEKELPIICVAGMGLAMVGLTAGLSVIGGAVFAYILFMGLGSGFFGMFEDKNLEDVVRDSFHEAINTRKPATAAAGGGARSNRGNRNNASRRRQK